MKFSKRVLSIFLMLTSIPFILKSVSLFNTIKDGDGIGLYFLGIEFNDKLRFEQIPKYAWGFLIIGLSLILISWVIYLKSLNNKQN